MEQADLLNQMKNVKEVEDSLKAYNEFWAGEDAGKAALQVLADVSAHPETLADEGVRMQLRLILLGLAIRKEHDAYEDYKKLIGSPVFLEHVEKEDWLVIEIPRILGLFGASGCLADISAMIQNGDCQTEIREQVMMAMIFRWLGRQESDGDIYTAVKDMLENGQSSLAQESQLGMALVVNAIAVGGNRLKTQILNFVKSGSEELRKNVSEKNIRSFLSLGSQRVKDMLKQNYEGPFKEPDYEIDLMIHPRTDEQTISPNAGKPIVRDEPKIGRNDPCPCGSGKKYKKCCGK